MEKRSDFERVLMNIAIDTAGSVHDEMRRLASGWQLRFTFDCPAPQFIPLEMAKAIDMPLKKGDIVRCQTNPNHHWGISVFVEQLKYSEWLLQEIGGDRQLKMGNESLDVLRFMQPSRLYTGHQRQVYLWASSKAFSKRYNKQADYFKRCGGVTFNGDTLIIWCRPHIWTMEKKGEDGVTLYAQPKKFTMQWGEKTRLKDIITTMRDQGFGSEFEFSPMKPTEGQAGYARFTKSDLEKIIERP
jgi:hypothetical protein